MPGPEDHDQAVEFQPVEAEPIEAQLINTQPVNAEAATVDILTGTAGDPLEHVQGLRNGGKCPHCNQYPHPDQQGKLETGLADQPAKEDVEDSNSGAGPSSTTAVEPPESVKESSHQSATDIEAGTQSGVQPAQQQNQATAVEAPTPVRQHRGILRRIAISDGQVVAITPVMRRGRPQPPPQRAETPLIDLWSDEPPAAGRPAAADRSTTTGTPRPELLRLDSQETWEDIAGGREGETAQIFVTFDPQQMCPCNLEGHPCMLPLRCRYQAGAICTRWVCLQPPIPSVSSLPQASLV